LLLLTDSIGEGENIFEMEFWKGMFLLACAFHRDCRKSQVFNGLGCNAFKNCGFVLCKDILPG